MSSIFRHCVMRIFLAGKILARSITRHWHVNAVLVTSCNRSFSCRQASHLLRGAPACSLFMGHLFEYLECFDQWFRRHSTLQYGSPVECEPLRCSLPRFLSPKKSGKPAQSTIAFRKWQI